MKFAGCALFSSVSNRARSSIWFLPFGSSHSAPSPNRHPFDSNRLWRGRDRFLAIGGPMNEDLMNRVISQVRIRLVLHRDQCERPLSVSTIAPSLLTKLRPLG